MHESGEYRWRVFVVAAIILTCLGLIVAKLFYLQVIQHDHYLAMAKEERWRYEEIPAERGTILDRNGHALATSVFYDALYAEPSLIEDANEVAEQLAPVIGEPADKLRDKLTVEQTAPILVKDGLPYDVAESIRQLDRDELYLLAKPQRVYPEGNLAAQILGVVGTDNQGLSGVEAFLNSELGGEPGVILAERDTAGEAIGLTISQYALPERGRDIRLTVDRFIQNVAEKELQQGIAESRAKGGSVVVLEPRTGAVLAMANEPCFAFDDPQLFTEDRIPLYRNPAVSDMYEPGSIFKIITMAAGLDSGAVTADHEYLNQGSFAYGGGVVRNAISRPQGMESMTQILVRSSNIGAAYVAVATGTETFYEYIRAFGFGEVGGVEILGESAGLVKMPGDEGWSDFDLAANSFGQGISVTPIQMACATAAIANGGTLMKPMLVQAISEEDGMEDYSPVVRRQVISPTTAKAVTEMMVAAVDNTEGGVTRASYLPGYRLAGKTGTAEIPQSGGYSQDDTITSFAGFGPADDPRFVIIVKIIEPQESQWAEAVAAPVFRNIAKQILAYYGIPPTEQTEG